MAFTIIHDKSKIQTITESTICITFVFYFELAEIRKLYDSRLLSDLGRKTDTLSPQGVIQKPRLQKKGEGGISLIR